MNIKYIYLKPDGIDLVIRNRLLLSSVRNVNDPFDAKPYFVFEGDVEQYIDRFKDRATELNLPLADQQLTNLREQLRDGALQRELIMEADNTWDAFNHKSKLVFSTDTPDLLIMWAYYTDKHKGFVVGIDFDELFELEGKPSPLSMQPVLYTHERPKVNVNTHRDALLKQIENIPRIKSSGWSAEREYRCVIPESILGLYLNKKIMYEQNNHIYLALYSNCIKEIYLGVNSQELKPLIISTLASKHRGTPIKLFQMHLDPTKYALISKALNA